MKIGGLELKAYLSRVILNPKKIFSPYRTFLIPEFINKGNRIQGAYILDTLLNWDDKPGVQEVSQYWHQALPKVWYLTSEKMVDGWLYEKYLCLNVSDTFLASIEKTRIAALVIISELK